MGTRIVIQHVREGWADIFRSDGMRAAVDEAGQRIAAEAGEGFEYYQSQNDRYTVVGFVSGDDKGNEREAEDKVLTKAVHA